MITALQRARVFDSALEAAGRDADFSLVEGLRVPLLAALLRRRGPASALLAVTATSREAQAVRDAFRCYLPGDAVVLELPAWETLPHERLSPSAETIGAFEAPARSSMPVRVFSTTNQSSAPTPRPAAIRAKR